MHRYPLVTFWAVVEFWARLPNTKHGPLLLDSNTCHRSKKTPLTPIYNQLYVSKVEREQDPCGEAFFFRKKKKIMYFYFENLIYKCFFLMNLIYKWIKQFEKLQESNPIF